MPVISKDSTITTTIHQCAAVTGRPFHARGVQLIQEAWIWENHRIWFCPVCGEDLEQTRKEAAE